MRRAIEGFFFYIHKKIVHPSVTHNMTLNINNIIRFKEITWLGINYGIRGKKLCSEKNELKKVS